MTEPSAEPQGALADSPWGRPLGVLVSPQATFRSLAARPSWLPPLLILLVLFVAAQALAMQRIDMEAAVRDAMEKQDQPIDEQQIATIAAMQSKVGLACNVVIFPLAMLALAAIFWGLANVAGGEIDFKRSLAVTAHGLMPNALSSLLTIPVILGRQEIDVAEAQHGLLASHLAAFAPEDAPAWLVALLARVDVFSLWSLALLVVGFAVVARLSKGAAVGVVGLLWLLWIGLMVGVAAMGWMGAS
jgi:hypothetical protein